MVHKHPQPVDDCPCFEDAIAFISVIMGTSLGRWHAVKYGFTDDWYRVVMPGSSFSTWADVSLWWLFAFLKMVVGTLVIFAWRLIAKPTLHIVLPPTFRLLAQIFTLPHRRFYTPATDYKSVPAENGLHPIPSVIDLPTQIEEVVDGSGIGRPTLRGPYQRAIKHRSGYKHPGLNKANGLKEKSTSFVNGSELALDTNDVELELVKHYDADGMPSSLLDIAGVIADFLLL
jgi:dihydrosphingosine 1-phosphate phosphatase